MWGYGFNLGITWNDGTGLQVQSTTPAPNGGQTILMPILGHTVPVTIRPYPRVGYALSVLAAPAQIFLEADTNEPPFSSMDLNALRPANWPGYTDTPCESVVRAGSPRHSQGYVYAYCDGHVKWQRYNGARTNFGDPANVTDVCSYYHDYDGSNNPGNCKTYGF